METYQIIGCVLIACIFLPALISLVAPILYVVRQLTRNYSKHLPRVIFVILVILGILLLIPETKANHYWATPTANNFQRPYFIDNPPVRYWQPQRVILGPVHYPDPTPYRGPLVIENPFFTGPR